MRKRKKFRVVNGGRRGTNSRDYQRRTAWGRYVPLWLGATVVGIGAGALTAYWPAGPTSDLSKVQSNEVRSAPQAVTVDDYAKRFEGSANGTDDLPATGVRARFSLCHVGGGHNCVVDGDTLYVQGVKIRVADIDAPETHEPKCASEKALGDRATDRLQQLVNSGTVTLASIDRDEDGYGRKLRIVKVDGKSVGDTLVDEGLARPYAGGRRPWC